MKRDMLKQQKFEKEFEALFSKNYTRLYHLAYQYLNDAETSKDIVSDAFEYLWRNYETFREKNPLAILHQTVRTKSIDYFRHSRVEANYAELYARMAPRETSDDETEKNERIERIYKVLEHLPPQTKHIMEECYFNRKKYAEVAQALNISPSAVKKHVMKALRLLRAEFNIKKGDEEVPEIED